MTIALIILGVLVLVNILLIKFSCNSSEDKNCLSLEDKLKADK